MIFPEARYENRFGTVGVPVADVELVQDHDLPARPPVRRSSAARLRSPSPDEIKLDLRRRDFTVNAIAWGRAAGAHEPEWIDPSHGLADLKTLILRAVGDPAERFDEDGLRLLRAARFAAQLGFEIEPATLAAMTATAEIVGHVSAERVGGELRRMIATDRPARALTILGQTGVLEHCLPELAAQIGLEQDKIPGHDLWQHSLTTLDAVVGSAADKPRLRLTALLHDIGKPTTFADGHFIGHDTEGARLAGLLLGRLAFARHEIEYVGALIANHMFNYESRWTDAAVRRFIGRIGRDRVDDLLWLRSFDNVGSGLAPSAGQLDELRERVARELKANAPLELRDLALDGNDLMTELGLQPGPALGELLERLLGVVIADPGQNRRDVLLDQARRWTA